MKFQKNYYFFSFYCTYSQQKQLQAINLLQFFSNFFIFIIFNTMGVYLSQPETSKKTVTQSGKKFTFSCSEMQGWRKNMEDAAIHKIDLGDGNSLFAVFDGHGGPQVSQFVQKSFTKILLNEESYQKKDYVKALDEAFRKMDELIESSEGVKGLKQIRYKNSKNNGDSYNNEQSISSGTGCTANVILMTDKKIYCANAGDSRSVLCRNGNAVPLSEDHKPQSQIEQKRITKAGGSIVMGRVNGGLNLTRSFGDFDYKRKKQLSYEQQMITCKPDIHEFQRSVEDEFILMGCDGIWERYVENNQGIIDLVRKQVKDKKSVQTIVENLLDTLLAKDTKEGIGCDNMTCILIKFH